MLRGALQMLWDAPGRFGVLWDTVETFRDALRRLWSFRVALGCSGDALGCFGDALGGSGNALGPSLV